MKLKEGRICHIKLKNKIDTVVLYNRLRIDVLGNEEGSKDHQI